MTETRDPVKYKKVSYLKDKCRIERVNVVLKGYRMVSDLFRNILQFFEWVFEAIGTVIIIYGGLRATFELLLYETLKKPCSLEEIRKKLTNKILFGLEFYIVVAILGTLRDPSLSELVLLGIVVLIRTTLGYFLSKEVKEYQFD